MSKNTGSNNPLWLVIGAWSLGAMVASVFILTTVQRPVDTVDNIREDLRIIRLILFFMFSLGVIIWCIGKIMSILM